MAAQLVGLWGIRVMISQTADYHPEKLEIVDRMHDVSSAGAFYPCRDNVSFVPHPDPHITVTYSRMDNRNGDKRILVDRLIRLFRTGDHQPTPLSNPFSYTLQTDPLGKPLLYFGKTRGPSISFSRCPGRIWAAMSLVKGLGIDAESAETFTGPYPYNRVFGGDEFSYAIKICGGRLDDASALLWSAKEAAAKAMGCGFHLFGPMEMQAGNFLPSYGGLLGRVDAGIKIPVWAIREGPAWLSIAWIK